MNGEGGIRTRDTGMTPYAGLANRCDESVTSVNKNTSVNSKKYLAENLALLASKSPDLVLVVEYWDNLPEAVKVGIMAMVKAAASME